MGIISSRNSIIAAGRLLVNPPGQGMLRGHFSARGREPESARVVSLCLLKWPHSLAVEHYLGTDNATALLRGIEQFNRGEFFAAHETWESVWLEASGQDKIFLQGIIQIAAAFHHWHGGNAQGTLSLLRRGLDKLSHFPREYRGVCVDRLREQAGQWAEVLESGAQNAPGKLPTIEIETIRHGGGDS